MDRSVPTSAASSGQVRKTVSIVFCDVTGSTGLGERLDPEALRQVMDRYFERMEAVLLAHGGTVEKFIGDAVMAVFGIPVLHEDDALRAVRAATEMRHALVSLNDELRREWGVELDNRIGVNTGEVVAGNAELGRTLVTGDAVNTAARLEQAARPGEIVIGEETHRLVRHAVVAEPLDPLALRGKVEPVSAFRLLSVESGLQRTPLRMDSPMVGRDRPLRLLHDAFEEALADRACYVSTVLGPAGIGKSRLAMEFLDRIAGAIVLSGRCLPYGEGITFWPIAEMLRGAAGIGEADPPASAQRSIIGLLEGAEDAEVVGTHLARLIGLTDGPRAEPGWALRRLLETLSSRAPVVAVFDDLHWAEPALLDAIEHVADLSRDAPILLLCLARPELLEERPAWGGGRARSSSVQLEPLGEVDARRLLENLLRSDALEPAVVERVQDAARGHPLFVEQMLSTLLETGALAREGDRWVVTRDLSTIPAPPAVTTLLAARLDRLHGEERALLGCAAVVGEVFELRAVEALASETVTLSVADRIVSLLRKDLIRPSRSDTGEADAYRFRHILIRDAAYEALPKHDRSALHERLADWIQATAGQRLAEYEELVGYHLEQAHRYRAELGPEDEHARALAVRGAARLAAAGRRVHDTRWDVDATVNLLSRAWDLVPEGHGIRLEIGPDLAGALAERGDFLEANRVAGAVLDEAQRVRDDLAAVRARVAWWQVRGPSDPDVDLGRMEADADAAIASLEASGDDLGAARAWLLKAETRWTLTDSGGRVEACERAAEHARRAGAGWEEAEAMGSLLWGLVMGDTPLDACRTRIEAILSEARASGNRRLEADALATLAGVAGSRGDLRLARRLLQASAQVDLDLGSATRYWTRSQTLGGAEWLAGNLPEAEQALRQGYEALSRLGETGFRSSFAAILGLILADLGDLDAALAYADEGEALGGPSDLGNVANAEIVRAEVLRARGHAAEAIEHAERAVAVSDIGDDLLGQALAHLALAEALSAGGRRAEAVAAACDALERAERKGVVVLADRARAVLASFQTGS